MASVWTGRELGLLGITGFIARTIMGKSGNVDDNLNAINQLNRKKLNAILADHLTPRGTEQNHDQASGTSLPSDSWSEPRPGSRFAGHGHAGDRSPERRVRRAWQS